MWRNDKNRRKAAGASLIVLLACLPGCARPQPTASQVAGPHAPPDLQRGPPPPGGPAADVTGGGAGGSAAAGIEAGRVGGIDPAPITPAYPPGRMAPTENSGSGGGDRGYAVSPDQPPVYPDTPGQRS